MSLNFGCVKKEPCNPMWTIVWPKIINKFAKIMVSALNLRHKNHLTLLYCTSSVIHIYFTDCSVFSVHAIDCWLFGWMCVVYVIYILLLLLFGIVLIGFGGDLCKQTKKQKETNNGCQCNAMAFIVDCIDSSWEIKCCCNNT